MRLATRRGFGTFCESVAAGTRLRHHHRGQIATDDFPTELALLGLESSPAPPRPPGRRPFGIGSRELLARDSAGNGCAERFIRVLQENLLWRRRVDTFEDLGHALHAVKNPYNQRWILQRHDHRTPAQGRNDQTTPAIAA